MQDIVSKAVAPDRSGEWSMVEPGESDPAAVLPVLAWLVHYTGGRLQTLSKLDAEWITQIREAAPNAEPVTVYRMARVYATKQERGESTHDLDIALAYLADGRVDDYTEAASRGLIEKALYFGEPKVFPPEVRVEKKGGKSK